MAGGGLRFGPSLTGSPGEAGIDPGPLRGLPDIGWLAPKPQTTHGHPVHRLLDGCPDRTRQSLRRGDEYRRQCATGSHGHPLQTCRWRFHARLPRTTSRTQAGLVRDGSTPVCRHAPPSTRGVDKRASASSLRRIFASRILAVSSQPHASTRNPSN